MLSVPRAHAKRRWHFESQPEIESQPRVGLDPGLSALEVLQLVFLLLFLSQTTVNYASPFAFVITTILLATLWKTTRIQSKRIGFSEVYCGTINWL